MIFHKYFYTIIILTIQIQYGFSQETLDLDVINVGGDVGQNWDPGGGLDTSKYFKSWSQRNKHLVNTYGYTRARTISDAKYSIAVGKEKLNSIESEIRNNKAKLAELEKSNKKISKKLNSLGAPSQLGGGESSNMHSKNIVVERIPHEEIVYGCGIKAASAYAVVSLIITAKTGKTFGPLIASIISMSAITHCQTMNNNHEEQR